MCHSPALSQAPREEGWKLNPKHGSYLTEFLTDAHLSTPYSRGLGGPGSITAMGHRPGSMHTMGHMHTWEHAFYGSYAYMGARIPWCCTTQ